MMHGTGEGGTRAMMAGMGIVWLLAVGVLVLLGAALVKYLFARR